MNRVAGGGFCSVCTYRKAAVFVLKALCSYYVVLNMYLYRVIPVVEFQGAYLIF